MRSKSCCAALVLITSLALAPLRVCAQGSDAAVAYQLNATHTGAIQTPGFKLPITVKWAVNLGGYLSYPIIAEGKVFVTVEDPATLQTNLYALSTQTGQIVWGPIALVQYPAGICYENGRLFYVPVENSTFGSGLMCAYDAATGNSLWSTTLPIQYFFTSPPTALNGIVYTGGAGEEATVYAVRETDGVVLWTAAANGGDDSSPVVTNEGVYVSYSGPQSYKFDPKTGRLLWHFMGAGEGGGGATPVLYNGQLYVEAIEQSAYKNNTGLILDAKNGALTGYFDPVNAYNQFIPAFASSRGFFVQDDTMTVQDVKTGATLWSASSRPQHEFTTPPLVVNGAVFVGAGGLVFGWSVRTGAEIVAQNLGIYGDIVQMGAAEGMLVLVAGSTVVALGHGIGLATVTLNPATVTATLPVQGTVTLSGPAPKDGLSVLLASTNAAASVPSTISVPGGRRKVTFTVTTARVSQATTGTIQATLGATTAIEQLTITPIGVSSLTLDPAVVTHGDSSIATVTLGAPAPPGGITVTFTSSNPAIAEAASPTLTIPAGATTGQMIVNTASVLAEDVAFIGAAANGISQFALLTLEP